MKICAACGEDLPRESFSKKQWQSKQHSRRCKSCVESDREAKPKAQAPSIQPKSSVHDEEVAQNGPRCFICLEGADEGEPLRRDCACRGDDAGFAHLSCLVRRAKVISNGILQDEEIHLESFAKPWVICDSYCNQSYQGDLARELANEMVSFVENEASKRGDISDCLYHIEALSQKLGSIFSKKQNRGEESRETAARIIALIRQVKDMGFTDDSILYHEAQTLLIKGHLLLNDSKDEALECYVKCCEICNGAPDLADLEQAAKRSIRMETNDTAMHDSVESCRQLYSESVLSYGKDSARSVHEGLRLVKALMESYQKIEGERLLSKLEAASTRIYGPNHNETSLIKSLLVGFSRRKVKIDGRLGIFQCLRYEESRDSYLVRGPGTSQADFENSQSFHVHVELVRFCPGTPVILHSLKNSKHLNGKIGDITGHSELTGRYIVHLADEAAGRQRIVGYSNLRILFKLPEEDAATVVNS